jgi:sec-independent protein translocase protein TatA
MELFTPGHFIVLVVVALVLFFGWKQLPDMARSLGRSLRIFKTEIKGMSEDDKARDTAKAKPAEPRAIAPPADVVKNRPRPAPGPAAGTPAQNGSTAARSETPASGAQ